MRAVMKSSLLLVAFAATALAATTAMAMNWTTYAPDEDGSRYWLDSDSVRVGSDGYTYAYFVIGPAGGSAPASTSAPIIGIKCATGDSITWRNGQWVEGPHFTRAAYLFNGLCPVGK
jgi:hypothetical protein